MQDIIYYVKKMLKKKYGKEPDRAVSEIFTTAAYAKINDGMLQLYYKDSKESYADIKKEIGIKEIQEAAKLRYEKESRYDDNPKIAAKWGSAVKSIEDAFKITLNKEYIGLYKKKAPICECGCTCIFIDGYASGIRKREGMIWYCEECGASIGVHMGTDVPLGIPASKDLGRKRIEVHREIDRLIDSGLSKQSIYKILQSKMKLKENTTHTGMFTNAQCEKALEILKGMKGGYRL